ncbi:MAG: lipoprotein LpqV [Mycobacterium sp.]|nr:lipoprotein LpqV [Mycobacterium sp.]
MQTNVIRAALLATTALAVLTGCGVEKPADHTATPAAELPAQEHPVPPNAIAVSPSGVTTAVDVPSAATESQYGQACHAAKLWMDAQRTDPKTLVEPYLKLMQQPGTRDPGNFQTPWTELTAAQQAGVIMAATSASRGECG